MAPMASLETFETTLKEVVQAKRLSASKVSKLTDIALKSMENDTQLVSILYRTHKSLRAAAKVHSLYAFDALARAARNQVNKHGLTGDINSEPGNCATFLLKVEGVLEGLFQDMISSGTPESKEKTQKILDIWTKSNTFPSAVLTRLAEVVKGTEKEPKKVKSATPPDPRTVVTQAPAVTAAPATQVSGAQPSPLPGVDPVQSTLLALLSQAAAVKSNGQTPPNSVQPQLDPNQLALLQQLTQTAKLGAGSPPVSLSPFVPPPPPPNSAPPESGPSRHPAPYRDDRYDSGRREPIYSRYDSPDRGRDRDDYYDDRSNSRGGYRGGFRGRGRGGSRWDDRDRFRDNRDFNSPPRGRRSRSRSPGRYGGRRDVRPYSPPRRPTMVAHASHTPESVPPAAELEKDEFGRDIRPQSPTRADPVVVDPRTQPPPAAAAKSVETQPTFPDNQVSSLTKQTSSVAAANTTLSSTAPDAAPPASSSVPSSSQPLGLDKFNLATFDFTAPSSWEALGKMWHVTYGYMPSEGELLQYVMSGGNAASGAATAMSSQSNTGQPVGQWPQSNWTGAHANVGNQTWRGGNRGRGGYTRGGRGNGYGHGNSRDDNPYNNGASDAVVLGGDSADGGDSEMQTSTDDGDESNPVAPDGGQQISGGGGGRMQRVGDKWVFVREATSGVA